MKNLICVCSGLVLAVVMTACGGGYSTSNAAGDKYIGTWARCTATADPTRWEKETLSISAGTTADTLAFSDITAVYFTADCTGAFGTPQVDTGTISSFAGTKVIGFDTVDQVFIGNGGLGQKQIMVIRTTNPLTLFTGRTAGDGGTLDANGYPTTLDTQAFVRQ
jgi:hypothetical protein